MDDERARAVAALWFGQSERPLIWLDDEAVDDVVRFLWALIWPHKRAAFAFCTFALQVRKIGRRPFDFLGAPPAARGAFSERTKSPAWWVGRGGLRSASVRAFADSEWIGRAARDGLSVFDELRRFCDEFDVSLPDGPALPGATQFLALEEAARVQLVPARARADLLFFVWPDISPTHPLSRKVLNGLLERQAEAPLGKQPLRELRDLVGRTPLQRLAREDQAFGATVEAVLEREVRSRLSAQRDEAEEELPELVAAAQSDQLRSAVLRAAVPLVTARQRAKLATSLLAVADAAGDVGAFHHALGLLPVDAREPPIQALAATKTAEQLPELWRRVGRAGEVLEDTDLVLAAYERAGALDDAIGAVAGIAARGGPSADRDLERALERVSPEARLLWALGERSQRLAAIALGTAERAAKELGLGLEAIAERSSLAPLEMSDGTPSVGARLFARVAADKSSRARDALRARAELVEPLLRLALSEGRPAASLLNVLFEVWQIPRETVPPLFQDLRANKTSGWTSDVVTGLVAKLVRELAAGRVTQKLVADAFSLPRVREQLAELSEYRIYPGVSAGERRSLLPAMAATALASVHLDSGGDSRWLMPLLKPLLDAAGSTELDQACASLADILRQRIGTNAREEFALLLLDRVRALNPPSGYILIEAALPLAYPLLVARKWEPPYWLRIILPIVDGWDRAKPWREWLAAVWVERAWPAGALLRSVGGDRYLLRQLISRMSRSARGLRFLELLDRTVQESNELREAWGSTVRRALEGFDDELDHD